MNEDSSAVERPVSRATKPAMMNERMTAGPAIPDADSGGSPEAQRAVQISHVASPITFMSHHNPDPFSPLLIHQVRFQILSTRVMVSGHPFPLEFE